MNDLILLAVLMEGPRHGLRPSKKLAGFMTGHQDMHNNLVYPLLRPLLSKNSWVTKTHYRRRTRTKSAISTRSPPRGNSHCSSGCRVFTEKRSLLLPKMSFAWRVGLFSMLETPSGARKTFLRNRDRWLNPAPGNALRRSRPPWLP